jgi:hypothetical protein
VSSPLQEHLHPLHTHKHSPSKHTYAHTHKHLQKNTHVYTQDDFIAVVVVVIGFVLLLCVLALFYAVWHKRHPRREDSHLVINPDDIKIINPPVRIWDGTWCVCVVCVVCLYECDGVHLLCIRQWRSASSLCPWNVLLGNTISASPVPLKHVARIHKQV